MVEELIEPLDVLEHVFEKNFLLSRGELSAAECLQVELERSDWAFELVRNAVDEVRLPPAEIDRLDREGQIEGGANDGERQEGGADRKQGDIEAGLARIGQD